MMRWTNGITRRGGWQLKQWQVTAEMDRGYEYRRQQGRGGE
jgi:hypothetical protein